MEERPLSYSSAILWSMLAAFLLPVLLLATAWLRPGADSDIINVGAVEATAFTIVTFLLLRRYAPGRPVRAALGLRRSHPALFGMGLGLGVILQIPVGSVQRLVEALAPSPEEVLLRRASLLTPDTFGQLVGILVVTTCVAPLVEELWARGALYGALCRSHPVIGAAGVSAFCFVLVHWEWRNWPGLLLVAATLAYLRSASGSLLPGLALHVAFNATTILALYAGISSVTRPAQFGWLLTIAGWAATAGLVFAVQRVARRSPEAAAARAQDAT